MSIPSVFSNSPEAEAAARRSMSENLVAAMREYARVGAGGRVWEAPGVVAVYSGRAGAIFNAVMLERAVSGEEELREHFAWAAERYEEVGARWSVWLAEHYVPREVLGRVNGLLRHYGLGAQHRSLGMAAEELRPARKALPELEVRSVWREEDRWNFCYVMSQAFATSMETYLDAYARGGYWEGETKGLVGYVDGQAVSTACYVPGRDAAGLYGVATLPAARGRGYGEWMVRTALEQARRETDCARFVLQASGQAAPLYRRLGFETVTHVTVYNEVA